MPEILQQSKLPKVVAEQIEGLESLNESKVKEAYNAPSTIESGNCETEILKQEETTDIQNIDQNSNKCRRYLEAARKRCIII